MATFDAGGIYKAAYDLWNNFINVAVTLFTTSPTSASGGVYNIAKTCFDALKAISIPIAIVFFIIAIAKDVIGVPPEQQVRKFLQDAIKFGILVGLISQLWLIMGYIIQIADGITDAVSSSGSYTMSMSSDLQNAINDVNALAPSMPDTSGMNFIEKASTLLGAIPDYIHDLGESIKYNFFLIIGGIATLVVTIGAGLTILSSAFQRIIKPLVVLPFSTITIAMAAGSAEAERVTTSYLKSFFGLCVSGAFMVISVKIGAALTSSGLVAFSISSLSLLEKIIYLSVQNIITPIVIAGLVKSADSMLSKFF